MNNVEEENSNPLSLLTHTKAVAKEVNGILKAFKLASDIRVAENVVTYAEELQKIIGDSH